VVFAGAAQVYFRNGDGDAVPLPGLREQPEGAFQLYLGNAHGLRVYVPVPAVAARQVRRVVPHPVVEEPFAGEVVVDAQQVGRAGVFPEKG
jgi:hypothetical protein